MKKFWIALLILVGITAAVLYSLDSCCFLFRNFKLGYQWKDLEMLEPEKKCYDFIQKNLSKEGYGIYTNYLETRKIGATAGGHEVLSESEGLMLLYYVQQGDKVNFDKHFDIVKKMTMKSGLVRWRISENSALDTYCSASIDDIRIAKALLYAYDRWQDKNYKRYLIKLMKAMKRYEVQNNRLIDFYDEKSKASPKVITTCYLDLKTIGMLSKIDRDWKKVLHESEARISGAYISAKFPLYRKSYDYEQQRYSNENNINMIESLLVVLHLSEVGKCPPETLVWLKNQLAQEGAIFSSYNIHSGEPSSPFESTAVYALCLQIACNEKDKALTSLVCRKMTKYQVQSINSEIYGAFGDTIKNEVFSFDNLQALLAFQCMGGL